MAQGLDQQSVRAHYAPMTDTELKRVLTEDALGLTPEAKEIALQEAQTRNFSPSYQTGIDAQNRAYLPSEIDALCEVIQTLPCPVCKKTEKRLNASLISETISMLILTNMSRKVVVSCPDCLDQAMLTANIKTAVLGWWGIPWGLIRTPQSLIRNVKYRRGHHADGPNDTLRSYVTANAAKITVLTEDKATLAKALAS